MKRITLCLSVLLLSFAVAGEADEPGKSNPKVVLVSLDGAADWLVDDFLARGVLPPDGALARLSRTGVRAEGMVTLDISATAPAHVSLYTGAYPEQTGIVSNTYHRVSDPITKSTSGYAATIEVETLWQAARRQGKRVVCIAAVGADATAPERTCDRTIGWGVSDGRAAVVSLQPTKDADWNLGAERIQHARALGATPDSPAPLAFQLRSGEPVALFALAADTLIDGQERYDTVLLDFDHNLGNGFAARLREGDWAGVTLSEDKAIGSWVKLLELAPESATPKLYLGAPSHTNAAPADFLSALNQTPGFWPDGPDDSHLNRSQIDEATWRQQAVRLNTWLRDATLQELQRDDWDLLFAYLPIIDETEHRFLLRHPRHPDYDAEGGERRLRHNRYVEWAYQTADRFLLEWIEGAPGGTNFIIVSDHGMMPIHTEVVIHTLLRQAGFKITDDETTQVRAYASVTTANIYVNLAGRQPGGVVAAEQLDGYVGRIVAACKALRDPATGEPVFEVVLTRAELGQVNLAHPENAGDVWVNTRPGFKVSGWMDEEAPLFRPARTEPATHGSLSSHPRIRSIFYAAGAGVPRGPLGLVRVVDVAPTVAALLGINPPADARGQAVFKPVE